MKTERVTDPVTVCPKCGYNDNPSNAVRCELCKASLSKFPLRAVGVLIALLAAGLLITIVYFFSRNKTDSYNSPIALQEHKSSIGSATSQTASLAESNINSDLRLYNSMRDVPNVPTGFFTYGGATCFAAMTEHGMNRAIAAAHPMFHLRYQEPLNAPPGCSTGIKMLLSSNISFAQNGRPINDTEYSQAKRRSFSLQQVPVAIDGLVFFTSPDIPVRGLSVNQLQDIFQGKITNWKQVGGSNLPIVPISLDPKVHATLKLLLDGQGQDIGRNVKIVRDYTTAIRQVASTKGAISYSSASIVNNQKTVHLLSLAKGHSHQYVPGVTKDGQVKVTAFRDGSYPLTRRLFVVIRRDGTPDEQAGVAYSNLLMSAEGQKIIEQAGFAALYTAVK